MTIDIQRNIKNLTKLGEWFISAWLREIYNYEDKENKNFIKYIDLVMHLDLYTTTEHPPCPIIVRTHPHSIRQSSTDSVTYIKTRMYDNT